MQHDDSNTLYGEVHPQRNASESSTDAAPFRYVSNSSSRPRTARDRTSPHVGKYSTLSREIELAAAAEAAANAAKLLHGPIGSEPASDNRILPLPASNERWTTKFFSVGPGHGQSYTPKTMAAYTPPASPITPHKATDEPVKYEVPTVLSSRGPARTHRVRRPSNDDDVIASAIDRACREAPFILDPTPSVFERRRAERVEARRAPTPPKVRSTSDLSERLTQLLDEFDARHPTTESGGRARSREEILFNLLRIADDIGKTETTPPPTPPADEQQALIDGVSDILRRTLDHISQPDALIAEAGITDFLNKSVAAWIETLGAGMHVLKRRLSDDPALIIDVILFLLGVHGVICVMRGQREAAYIKTILGIYMLKVGVTVMAGVHDTGAAARKAWPVNLKYAPYLRYGDWDILDPSDAVANGLEPQSVVYRFKNQLVAVPISVLYEIKFAWGEPVNPTVICSRPWPVTISTTEYADGPQTKHISDVMGTTVIIPKMFWDEEVKVGFHRFIPGHCIIGALIYARCEDAFKNYYDGLSPAQQEDIADYWRNHNVRVDEPPDEDAPYPPHPNDNSPPSDQPPHAPPSDPAAGTGLRSADNPDTLGHLGNELRFEAQGGSDRAPIEHPTMQITKDEGLSLASGLIDSIKKLLGMGSGREGSNNLRDAVLLIGLLKAVTTGMDITSFAKSAINAVSNVVLGHDLAPDRVNNTVKRIRLWTQRAVLVTDTNTADLLRSPADRQIVHDLMREGRDIELELYEPCYKSLPMHAFRDAMRVLRSQYKHVVNETKHGGDREVPVLVYMSGAPGTGKTEAMKVLCKQLCKELRVPPETNIFALDPSNSNFPFSGYNGQAVVAINEIAQDMTEAGRVAAATSIIRLIDSAAYSTPQAEIEFKANRFFTSKVVVTTTNVSGNMDANIASTAAMRRRYDIRLTVHKNPNFVMPIDPHTGSPKPGVFYPDYSIYKLCDCDGNVLRLTSYPEVVHMVTEKLKQRAVEFANSKLNLDESDAAVRQWRRENGIEVQPESLTDTLKDLAPVAIKTLAAVGAAYLMYECGSAVLHGTEALYEKIRARAAHDVMQLATDAGNCVGSSAASAATGRLSSMMNLNRLTDSLTKVTDYIQTLFANPAVQSLTAVAGIGTIVYMAHKYLDQQSRPSVTTGPRTSGGGGAITGTHQTIHYYDGPFEFPGAKLVMKEPFLEHNAPPSPSSSASLNPLSVAEAVGVYGKGDKKAERQKPPVPSFSTVPEGGYTMGLEDYLRGRTKGIAELVVRTKCGEVKCKQQGDGIYVAANAIIFPGHYLNGVGIKDSGMELDNDHVEGTQSGSIELRNCHGTYMLKPTLGKDLFVAAGKFDVAVLVTDGIPFTKDLSSCFWTDAIAMKGDVPHTGMIMSMTREKTKAGPGQSLRFSQYTDGRFADEVDYASSVTTPDGVKTFLYKCGSAFRYSASTTGGWCGSPVSTSIYDHPMFIGFHTAGAQNSVLGGTCQLLTYEGIQTILKNLREAGAGIITLTPQAGLIAGDPVDNTVVVDHDEIPAYMPGKDPHIDVCDADDHVVIPNATAYRAIRPWNNTGSTPTAIKTTVFEELYGPSDCGPCLRGDILAKLRGNLGKHAGPADVPSLNLMDDFVEILRAALPPSLLLMSGPLRTLTFREAVEGIPGLGSLDMETSPGAPYNKMRGGTQGKSKFFLYEHDVTGRKRVTSFIPELQAHYEQKWAAAQEGTYYQGLYNVFVKDETLPKPKCDIKVRSLVAANVVDCIIMRQLYGDIFARIALHHRDTPVKLGMNVHDSAEWSAEWEPHINEFFRSICGDFSGWDLKLKHPVMAAVFRYFRSLYHESIKLDRARACCAADAMNALRALRGIIYRVAVSGPSGYPGTTVVNSCGVIIVLVYAMMVLTGESAAEIVQFVKMMTYGDDNASAVPRPYWDRITAIKLGQVIMEVFAMEFTDAAKTGELRDYTPIDEQTFLSRSHTGVAPRMNAPLKMATIYNILRHSMPDSGGNDHLNERVLSACSEWYHHGRKVYEFETKRLEKFMAENRLPYTDPITGAPRALPSYAAVMVQHSRTTEAVKMKPWRPAAEMLLAQGKARVVTNEAMRKSSAGVVSGVRRDNVDGTFVMETVRNARSSVTQAVGDYAGGFITNALDTVAGWFGFDKPLSVAAALPQYPSVFHDATHGDGLATSVLLTHKPTRAMAVGPSLTGDETNFNSLATLSARSAVLDRFQWTGDMAPGALLANYAVDPRLVLNRQVLDSGHPTPIYTCRPTPLAAVAITHRLYRGRIDYTFHIFASVQHAGRLRFAFQPVNYTTTAFTTSVNTYTVDIEGGTVVEVSVNYVSPTVWADAPMGYLQVICDGRLISPAGASTRLDILTLVKGTNMQYACPGAGFYLPANEMAAGAPDTPYSALANIDLVAQGGTDEMPAALTSEVTTDTSNATVYKDTAVAPPIHKAAAGVPAIYDGFAAGPDDDPHLHREVVIFRTEITPVLAADTLIAALDIFHGIAADPMVARRLEGHKFIQTGYEVNIRIAAGQNTFGALLVSYSNAEIWDLTSQVRNIVMNSSYPSALIDVSSVTNVPISIPHYSPKPNMVIAEALNNYGVGPVVDIVTATVIQSQLITGTQPISITVTARLVDTKFTGYTDVPMPAVGDVQQPARTYLATTFETPSSLSAAPLMQLYAQGGEGAVAINSECVQPSTDLGMAEVCDDIRVLIRRPSAFVDPSSLVQSTNIVGPPARLRKLLNIWPGLGQNSTSRGVGWRFFYDTTYATLNLGGGAAMPTLLHHFAGLFSFYTGNLQYRLLTNGTGVASVHKTNSYYQASVRRNMLQAVSVSDPPHSSAYPTAFQDLSKNPIINVELPTESPLVMQSTTMLANRFETASPVVVDVDPTVTYAAALISASDDLSFYQPHAPTDSVMAVQWNIAAPTTAAGHLYLPNPLIFATMNVTNMGQPPQ